MAITQATQLADFTSGIGTAGAILEVDNVSNKIGIGTTNPQALLQVGQIIKMDGPSGIITATTFSGNFTGNITGNATGLSGTPNITVNNIIGVGATFTGVVTYEDVTNVDSIGIVTARSGIHVDDSITHINDTNTKIRFPSADTFTVETSGVERLRVGSTGTVGVAGLSTATSFGAFNHLSAPFGGGTVSYTVTVASKTADHRYNGSGSSNAYLIDGVQSPFLTFTPGRTYRFTNDNTGSHPLKFYLEADKTTLYSTGVTFDNSYTEIVVSDSTPQVLHYQCTNHSLMGNAVQTNSNIGGGFNVVDESSDTTCFPLFATAATGTALAAKSGTNLTFNSSTGALTATSFVGALTGNVTGNISGGTVAGSTGTFTGDVDIADKIIHTGDTNTAIRFPAADTFTVETGGTERLRVTSGGDIGIGNVTSPSTNIEIRTDANDEGVLIKSTGSTSNALDFDANRSGAENALASIRGKWNGTTVAQVTFLAGSDTTNKDDGVITFGTESAASNGNANATERLRITSAGNVRVPDGGAFACGTDEDLTISHSGNDAVIENDVGHIYIRNNTDDEDIYLIADDGSGGLANYVECDGSSGKVKLSYYGSKKLETTSAGVEVTGTLNATTDVQINGKGAATTGKAIAMAMIFG